MRKWLTNDPILSAKINSQEDHVKEPRLAELQQEDQTFTKSQFRSALKIWFLEQRGIQQQISLYLHSKASPVILKKSLSRRESY